MLSSISILWLSLFSFVAAQSNSTCNSTYTNPILNGEGADPWVTQYEGWYYMTYTTNDNITIHRSQSLTNWNNAEQKLAFSPPAGEPYSYDLWAPELHNIDGLWYIIFTADSDADSPPPSQSMNCDFDCPAVNHRMFVLESSGSDPWTSDYTMKGMLDTFDQFAIDGTYFQYNGNLYHIYSCWYDTYISWPSMLCITQLENPWTNKYFPIASNRTIISAPTNPWEKTPYGRTLNIRLSSNEGPQQLTNPYTSQTFIIYSAARSDNANYCLGLLEFVGTDPMNAEDWRKNNEGCVFYQDRLTGAYGVGHASFVEVNSTTNTSTTTTSTASTPSYENTTTTSTADPEDGSNTWWLIYHGMADPTTGWSARTIRTQQFTWDVPGSGWPVFPRPGYGPYSLPDGVC